MAENLKVELNSQGIRELLKSQEVMDACEKEAKKVQDRAGEGYELSRYTGASRVNVSVSAQSGRARAANRGDRNELLKAVTG